MILQILNKERSTNIKLTLNISIELNIKSKKFLKLFDSCLLRRARKNE